MAVASHRDALIDTLNIIDLEALTTVNHEAYGPGDSFMQIRIQTCAQLVPFSVNIYPEDHRSQGFVGITHGNNGHHMGLYRG